MSPTPFSPFRPAAPSRDGQSVASAGRGAFVDWPPSLRRPPFGQHLAQDHAHHHTAHLPLTRPAGSWALSKLGPNSRGWSRLSIVRGPISNDEFTSGVSRLAPWTLHRHRQPLPQSRVDIVSGRRAFAQQVKLACGSDSRGGLDFGDGHPIFGGTFARIEFLRTTTSG